MFLSVKSNTFTTDKTLSGTGIKPLPSNQDAVILLSTLSVAVSDAFVFKLYLFLLVLLRVLNTFFQHHHNGIVQSIVMHHQFYHLLVRHQHLFR